MNSRPRSWIRPCPKNHRTRVAGFTLIEILTVIAVIAILIGMLFVAFKYVHNSAGQASTKVALNDLAGMLGELDAANHLGHAPAAWLWWNASGNTPPYMVSSGGTPDFWRYPYASVTTPNVIWDALDSPGDVRADTGAAQDNQRNGSFAIVNTQLAMQLLATVSANRAAMDKISENSRFIPLFGSVPAASAPTPYLPPSNGLLKDDGSDGTTPLTYPPGVHLAYQGKFYVSVTATNTPPPSPGAWYDESAAPRGAPLLKDGWGNPIIFVPASGLHVKLLNGQPNYTAAATGQDFIFISPEGQVNAAAGGPQNGTNPVVTKIGRPFFASAGPDGDFTKGDDNIYSFNN